MRTNTHKTCTGFAQEPSPLKSVYHILGAVVLNVTEHDNKLQGNDHEINTENKQRGRKNRTAKRIHTA